ncbi:hypothetical protein KM043_015398 [Ampulex compressa]|nr:hypothetical protein KM043_015398 [Ampulex compressa]
MWTLDAVTMHHVPGEGRQGLADIVLKKNKMDLEIPLERAALGQPFWGRDMATMVVLVVIHGARRRPRPRSPRVESYVDSGSRRSLPVVSDPRNVDLKRTCLYFVNLKKYTSLGARCNSAVRS